MIPYILHVTVITTVCFLFYKLLLQKETFYRLNRWTLLGCLAVSFALPLLPVPREWSWREKFKEKEVVLMTPERAEAEPEPQVDLPSQPATELAAVSQEQPKRHGHRVEKPVVEKEAAVSGIADAGNKSSKITTGTPAEKNGGGTPARFFSGVTLLLAVQWLFYCYLLGVVIFGGNFLLQLAVLLYQSYSRPVIRDGRFRIVETSGDRAPCSFGNTIFINPGKYDWETYNQILIHEKIHVSGRHTLDILLAEMALVIQWFNPFVWLYRREVENNLEFLTDADVLLDATIERSAYQLSLLRVSAPHLSFSLTNNYNQSLLKRRIVMMNSQRSSLHTVWKYFFLIPLLTGLMCALNKPAIALGAVTTKLSMAHAPLFSLIAPILPIHDTAKKPARATDNTPAAASKPVKVTGTSSGDASSSGDVNSSGDGASSGEGSSEGTGTTYSYGNSSGDDYGTAVTIDVNPAVQVPVKVPVKVNYNYDNVSIVKAAVNAKVKADVHVFVPPVIITPDDTVLTDGSWYVVSYGDKLSFDLKAGDDDHNWSTTIHVDKSEIDPFPGQGSVSFKLTREAGTVEFKGQFDGQEGFGHFHFIPDPAYFPALKQLGVEDIEDRRQFGFFAMNIRKDYVNMLIRNGYPHISERDLLSFAAMRIDEAYINYWKGADLGEVGAAEPRTLIRLKALKIDRAYVDELKAAGYDHLSLHELESLKAQHIDKAYIQSLGRGANTPLLPVRELVSYKAMHIDSSYLQELGKLGYGNLEMREVTGLYAMHVTPEFIKGFRDIGYTELSPRELTSLKAMGVTPDMVKGYQAAGYKNLNPRSLGDLKAMNVTPEFIKGYQDLGYTDLTARDLSSLKAMGVTPEFVAGFQKLGFDHIPVRDLVRLKAVGVTPEYVSKMKAQGFDSKELSKYVRLKTDFN